MDFSISGLFWMTLASHSQIIITLYPINLSSSWFFLSLSIFFVNLAFQYSELLLGLEAILHPSCWCQKQPCTKMTVLYFGSTISGLPGRSLRLMRNLKPSLWRIDRIIFSGLVSLLLIRDITWLRFSGEKTSMSWVYQACIIITILHLPTDCLPTFHPISPTLPVPIRVLFFWIIVHSWLFLLSIPLELSL